MLIEELVEDVGEPVDQLAPDVLVETLRGRSW
jgi:hypothetical protein